MYLPLMQSVLSIGPITPASGPDPAVALSLLAVMELHKRAGVARAAEQAIAARIEAVRERPARWPMPPGIARHRAVARG